MIAKRKSALPADPDNDSPPPSPRTRRIAVRRPDGTVQGYITIPDPADPIYQERLRARFDEWHAALEAAAHESGLTLDELLRELGGEEE